MLKITFALLKSCISYEIIIISQSSLGFATIYLIQVSIQMCLQTLVTLIFYHLKSTVFSPFPKKNQIRTSEVRKHNDDVFSRQI